MNCWNGKVKKNKCSYWAGRKMHLRREGVRARKALPDGRPQPCALILPSKQRSDDVYNYPTSPSSFLTSSRLLHSPSSHYQLPRLPTRPPQPYLDPSPTPEGNFWIRNLRLGVMGGPEQSYSVLVIPEPPVPSTVIIEEVHDIPEITLNSEKE